MAEDAATGRSLIGYGLGKKLTFVFGALISVFVVAVIYINVQIQLELVRERLELRSQQLVRLGIEVSLPYLIDGRPDELEPIFEEISAQPDVETVYLLSEHGDLLVDGGDIEVGGFLASIDDPLAQAALRNEGQVRAVDGNTEKFAHPIVVGSNTFGVMRLNIRLDTLKQEIRTVWTRNAIVGAIFILMGLATSNLLARRLTKPLIRLTEATNHAVAGDLDQKIEVNTNDEIGSLAASFQQLLTTMRDSIHRIHRLAYLDELTNIPNRAWFSDQIERLTLTHASEGKRFAVMFLDVDNFKSINDRHGHYVGDVLLKSFADRLSACIHRGGLKLATIDDPATETSGSVIAARLGGDEFTIALPCDNAETVAQAIIVAMSEPINVGSLAFSVSTSIGIGVFPDQAGSSEEVLKIADTAMYQAKQAGRNCYRFYDKTLHQDHLDAEEMLQDLKDAIANDELSIYMQPQFEVGTDIASGAEALIRWQHPKKGLLSPHAFLPLAAKSGLLPDVGRVTTKLAIEAAARIQFFADRPFVVAVNLSVEELVEPGFIHDLRAAILQSGIDPRGLEIEITENTAMFDDKVASDYINLLRSQGVRLAIDDFGMGYSNLGRLKNLAFDTLKVDKTLLEDVAIDQESALLMTTIFDLARAVRADVVAEGVETEDQLRFLREHGCKYFQGYLGGRPAPIEDFEIWLREHFLQHSAGTAGPEIAADGLRAN